jgi:cytochrome c peroxidase
LRNIFLTAPYMHDGSKKTFDDVLDHYTSGIKNHQNLDPILKEKQIRLSKEERSDLKQFLLTLHDDKLLVDPRFSDPFIN